MLVEDRLPKIYAYLYLSYIDQCQMDDDQMGMVVIVRHKGRPYDHYGILDGEGGVIHVNKYKNMITLDPLERVLRNAVKIDYIFEDRDTRLSNLERARLQIGSHYNYSVLSSNCENWTNEVRFGTASSVQIDKVATYLSLLSLILL
jgi:hypothetical protein